MTILTPAEGIIVRAVPYGEADLILTALCSPGGKAGIFARNARSAKMRFGSRLDVFDQGLFELGARRGQLFTLKGFTPRHSYPHLRCDLDKFTAASVAVEGFEAFTQEDEERCEEVVELLSLCLHSINEAKSTREALRSLLLGLEGLLKIMGLGQETPEKISASGLISVVEVIERYSERKLLSKGSLLSLLTNLKDTKQPVRRAEKGGGGRTE